MSDSFSSDEGGEPVSSSDDDTSSLLLPPTAAVVNAAPDASLCVLQWEHQLRMQQLRSKKAAREFVADARRQRAEARRTERSLRQQLMAASEAQRQLRLVRERQAQQLTAAAAALEAEAREKAALQQQLRDALDAAASGESKSERLALEAAASASELRATAERAEAAEAEAVELRRRLGESEAEAVRLLQLAASQGERLVVREAECQRLADAADAAVAAERSTEDRVRALSLELAAASVCGEAAGSVSSAMSTAATQAETNAASPELNVQAAPDPADWNGAAAGGWRPYWQQRRGERQEAACVSVAPPYSQPPNLLRRQPFLQRQEHAQQKEERRRLQAQQQPEQQHREAAGQQERREHWHAYALHENELPLRAHSEGLLRHYLLSRLQALQLHGFRVWALAASRLTREALTSEAARPGAARPGVGADTAAGIPLRQLAAQKARAAALVLLLLRDSLCARRGDHEDSGSAAFAALAKWAMAARAHRRCAHRWAQLVSGALAIELGSPRARLSRWRVRELTVPELLGPHGGCRRSISRRDAPNDKRVARAVFVVWRLWVHGVLLYEECVAAVCKHAPTHTSATPWWLH